MKVNFAVTFFLMGLLILSACGNRPSWVLSEKKMEDVLFDVRIADAEVVTNPTLYSDYPEKKKELLDAVFKKHKVTVQEFDTSLVWYNGNWRRYKKINDAIITRYTVLHDTLELRLRPKNPLPFDNLISIWEGRTKYLLTATELKSKPISFTVNLDTLNAAVTGETYQVQFDVLGLTNSTQAMLVFCGSTADSVMVSRTQLATNQMWNATLSSGTQKKFSKLSGSLYISNYPPDARIIIYNFGVYRVKPK